MEDDGLEVRDFGVDDDDIQIFDIRNDRASAEQQVYSCVALYRKGWRDDWPALGGTRWLQATGDEIPTPEMARAEAASLALAMFAKNNLIRKAELELEHRERILFGWQGGKGVIWTPWEPGKARANVKHLTPRRLMHHGRLIEHLQGEYIGSKDAGIGGTELRWIERTTNFTIGNGCKRDTGEGTACGVHAGMRTALEVLGKGLGDARKLKDVPVLICGLGKVGFPLMQLLHEDGAKVSIWEPSLAGASENDLIEYYDKTEAAGAAIDRPHLETLKALRTRIFRSEIEALETATEHSGIHFICPAGSRIEWLNEHVAGQPRYAIVASRSDADSCVILGPANDQLPLTREHRDQREAALRRMTEAGVLFVPDPIVSPGGVVAVSHELTARWRADDVNRDSAHIVEKSVRMLFGHSDDPRSSSSVYRAFEHLAFE